MRREFTIRVRVVTVAFFLVVILLIARLYVVQIVNGKEYKERAEAQYITSDVSTEERNDIFFRSKDGQLIAAAVMQSGYKVAINPTMLIDAAAAYAAVNAIVPINEDRFLASAGKKSDPYEEIMNRLTKDQAAAIEKLHLAGVILVPEKWRVYPGEERAAHVLGFVGYKDEGHERVGRYGIERYWQDVLTRSGGLYVNFFADIFANIGALTMDAEHSSGDIITSIEPTVEQRLEETLASVERQYHSKITGGIIMDPRDGSIIAMAATPDYDPNTFNTVSNAGIFTNPVIENVYELGSIMKPLTMASAVDLGLVTASTTYNDAGCIMRDDAKVCNFDGKGRGVVSMQEVLNQSLNTGAAFVAEKLGAQKFSQYMLALGFGEETGIDLPGEVHGIVSALKSGSALDLASASFGQGIAVTPIEMARALGALANHGVLATPHVADQIQLKEGIRRKAWQKDERRVFSAESADAVTDMLITVVDTALLHGRIKMERYSIAAKTGTAQIAMPGGGYYTDRYLHSFFGYFPARDPQFLIVLFTVEPQNVNYASQTLTQPFSDLTNFLISYYDIPPDR